ncbi:MAG TPA: IS66 family transposase [Acidobacteriaceae bacterium]|nr:IS66 family transposase [Acidobacteriaceae bacterium]
MRAKERIAQLEAELAAERAEKAEVQAEFLVLRQQMDHLLAYVAELEGRLRKDSHNSSKPPSSDGLARTRHQHRKSSEKKTGGQAGHEGRSLQLREQSDVVHRHRPQECPQCQQPLEGVEGAVVERRQVHDLPVVRVQVTEHQVEQVQCPHCQHVSRGTFPAAVAGPVQYGPNVRALAVYLHAYQLVPLARTSELLSDLCDCEVSEGSVTTWVQQAAETLLPTLGRIAELLGASRVQHGDETGMRIGGKLHWMHVNSTRFLTHLAWHAKRGKQAMDAIGIWPHFTGRAMHDRWSSYDQYHCVHSVCGAHLVRDCPAVEEQGGQEWAAEMRDVLLSMARAAEEWRQRGAVAVPLAERNEWVAQYFDILARGFAAQRLPSAEEIPKRRGRPKQSAAKNLLDDLLRRADQVLAFLDDLSLPFTNNLAERDLRMVKVQQKISGTFRSEAGASAFCRIRSYLSTMRKQGHGMLVALAAVFAGEPLPIAWGI